MGLGNVTINVAWKFAVVAIYAALYELTPLRVDPDQPVGLGRAVLRRRPRLLLVPPRLARGRVFWASHVVHHSAEHYNLSTALRQTWVPMTYLPFWLPLPLLGFPPWMVLLAQAVA